MWNILVKYAFKLIRICDPYHGYIPDLSSSVTFEDAVKKLRLI
jgi:hypothetical protein